MERKGTVKSKEKREINGKGGELVLMKYVSRIVEVRYWQPYRLAPLKMSWPPFSLPTQKSWRRHCCGSPITACSLLLATILHAVWLFI